MRRLGWAIVGVLLVTAVVWWTRSDRTRPVAVPVQRQTGRDPWAGRAGNPSVAARLTALRTEIGADATSPIANELNAPDGTPQRDLQIVNAVFEAWQTNFPGRGNPVGDNDEITLALAGDNALKFAFISPRNRAINAAGELCDRWGTPYRLHQLSGTIMEIWSAGPDHRFGTADDLRLTPGDASAVRR
jgi:hypothetical protein